MKIPNKAELQQTAIINSSDIDFKYFMKIDKRSQQEHTFSWLMIQFYHQMILYVLCKIFYKEYLINGKNDKKIKE